MDVTDRKHAEDTLREADRQKTEYLTVLSRYRTLFESIDEGFCIIEMIFDEQSRPVDYRFVEVNPAFERQSGLADALGKRMREMVPDHDEHWFTTYGRIALTGESARFESRAEAMGRWFDVYAFRFGNPDDHQVAVLFTDVSERKRAAEELRRSEATLAAFFNASPGILNIVDDRLRYVSVPPLDRTPFRGCKAAADVVEARRGGEPWASRRRHRGDGGSGRRDMRGGNSARGGRAGYRWGPSPAGGA